MLSLRSLKHHSYFVVVLCLSTLLRFIPLFNYQFTYDELSALERTQYEDIGTLIRLGIQVDAHPALLQILIFYTVKLFGYNAWFLKLPFLLCSLAGLWYGYQLALNNFSKAAANFFVSFLAFSLIFVFYAPVARMYGCGVFFSLALLYYFFEIVSARNTSIGSFVRLMLFALLSALNHHMNALFAATVLLSGFFFLPKNKYKTYALSIVLTAVSYLPHLSITLHQLGLGGIGVEQNGWLDKPYADAFYTFLKVLFGTGYVFFVFLGIVILALLTDKKIRIRNTQWFLLLVFALNYAVIYTYSIWRAPIFQNSVMLFSGTAVLLFFCSLLQNLQGLKHSITLGGITLLLLFQTYVKKDFFHQAVQNNYACEFLEAANYSKTYGSQHVAAVFFDADPFMKTVYQKQYGKVNCFISTDSVCRSYKAFGTFVKNSPAQYLVLGAAMPQYQAMVKAYFPYLYACRQAQNIHLTIFSKVPPKQAVLNPDSVLFTSTPAQRAPFDYAIEQSAATKQTLPIRVSANNEFPFACKSFYGLVLPSEGQMLVVQSTYDKCTGDNHIQTCIAVHQESNHQSLAYTATGANEFVCNNDSSITAYTPFFAGSKHRSTTTKAGITVYLWNLKHNEALLKNFSIQGIDYWHERWHYWD